ncbi:glycosyl hydrolase [Microbacterium lacusdiani]
MSIKTWFAEHLNPKHWTVKTRVVVASVTALALAGGGVGAAFALRSPAAPGASPSATPTATASPTPTPTPTPTPEPAALPRAAAARAVPGGWDFPSAEALPGVLPEVGSAAEGSVALVVDAPRVDEPMVAAAVTVPVEPGVEYTFAVDVRRLGDDVAAVPVELMLAGSPIELPQLGSAWWTIEHSFTAAADQSTVDFQVALSGPIRGFGIDRVSMKGPDGAERVPNGSLEDLTSGWGIVNDSLILNEQMATLAVTMAPGRATWVAKKRDGSEAARGTSELGRAVSAVRLDGLTQGYYDVAVTDATGATVSTPIGVVRMPEAYLPLDGRLGAHIHPTQDRYDDAAAAASSAGLGAVRQNITWAFNELQRGVYEFRSDEVESARRANARGLGVLGIAGWGNKLYDRGLPPHTAEGLSAYGDYAAAVAQNYDLIGLELFNEFNIPTFNPGPCGLTGDCYYPLAEAAYGKIKAVAPDLPVIVGVTGNYDDAFYQQLWGRGGLNHSDAMSFHPYQVYFGPEGLDRVVRQARDTMNAHGEAKPIWITELGWTSKTGDVSLEEQGARLVRAQSTALAAGVERYFWYDLINDTTEPADHEGNFGLFWQKRDGVAAQPPKPAAFVQALFIAALDGRAFQTVDRIDGVRSVSFGDVGDVMKVVYPTAGETTVEYPAWDTVTVTDLSGAVTELEPRQGAVTVDLDRIVLVSGGVGEAPAGR